MADSIKVVYFKELTLMAARVQGNLFGISSQFNIPCAFSTLIANLLGFLLRYALCHFSISVCTCIVMLSSAPEV